MDGRNPSVRNPLPGSYTRFTAPPASHMSPQCTNPMGSMNPQPAKLMKCQPHTPRTQQTFNERPTVFNSTITTFRGTAINSGGAFVNGGRLFPGGGQFPCDTCGQPGQRPIVPPANQQRSHVQYTNLRAQIRAALPLGIKKYSAGTPPRPCQKLISRGFPCYFPSPKRSRLGPPLVNFGL